MNDSRQAQPQEVGADLPGRRVKALRGGRHLARELTLQALYQAETSGAPIYQAILQICEDHVSDEVVDLEYFRHLARAVWQRLEIVDPWIVKLSENWSLDRVSIIDRSILRMGIYELLEEPELPAKVVINEAIELSKRYGGDGSSRFINGLLDKVAEQVRGAETAAFHRTGRR